MALELEQHLKELCEQHRPQLPLYNRLKLVRASAEAIWTEQRLRWFTDHKAATHSVYIIKHLGSVLKRFQGTDLALNPHELYVLLAACYLHDIGMQDFRSEDGRGEGQFTEADYKRIRKNHPKRGRELIIERTKSRGRDDFSTGLDPESDGEYLALIALVSQGHGSAFFLETVAELQELTDTPGNMPFRGDLLTALLLMGDELDLHELRATFDKEITRSPVTLLHHHIHHYVTGVEIIDGRTRNRRRIRLTMKFPEDSDGYRADIRNWLVAKLLKQSELTNPILEQATQGELLWDDQIEIRETIDRYGIKRSLLASEQSKMALYELRRDVKEVQTVNRDELIAALREGFRQSKHHFQAIQVIDRENSDWGHLANRLSALGECNRITLISRGFQLRTGRDPLGVLQYLSDELTEAGCLCSRYQASKSTVQESQYKALSLLGQALLADMQAWTEKASLVLLLERVDEAESDTLRWLAEWLLPELSNQNIKLLLIFTQSENGGIEEISGHVRIFHLAPFTKDHIMEHFQSRLGLSSDRADLEADLLFSSTSGMPDKVYAWLYMKLKQGFHILSI